MSHNLHVVLYYYNTIIDIAFVFVWMCFPITKISISNVDHVIFSTYVLCWIFFIQSFGFAVIFLCRWVGSPITIAISTIDYATFVAHVYIYYDAHKNVNIYFKFGEFFGGMHINFDHGWIVYGQKKPSRNKLKSH